MIGRIDGLRPIARWLRHARENYDGSGFPDGLSGEQIPLAARVLRVVDAFIAMTSERPYRPAMSVDEPSSSCAATRAACSTPAVSWSSRPC